MIEAGFVDLLTQGTECPKDTLIIWSIQPSCLHVINSIATVSLKFDAKGKPTIDLGGTFSYILQIWNFLETQATITQCDLFATI